MEFKEGEKINITQQWFAEEYNLTLGKAYEVIRVNPFWCSVTIENDVGKRMGVDVSRVEKVIS